MPRRMSPMTVARPSPNEQLTFLAPSEAALVELVRQNLRLLAELRSTYQTAGGQTDGRIVRSAEDVAALLAPEMEMLTQEQLRVILLDTRNRVLDVLTIYQGNVNSTIVRMAEVFREAIVVCAPNVILAHNHPSGDPSPSPEDASLTKQAVEAGRLLGIEVLDHIVIGRGRYVSLKDQGVL
jgi:DNA repair protein RadC